MNSQSIEELLFEVRYSVRVLERQARFWRKIEATIKVLSLLSGSSAFAAIMAANQTLTLATGIAFAITQALDFALEPNKKSNTATASGNLYSRILADKSVRTNCDKLEDALFNARINDPVVVFDSINVLAYNDVAKEKGYFADIDRLSYFQKIMKIMA